MELLKVLAKQGNLVPLVEKVRTFTYLIPRVKQFPSHPTPEVDNLKYTVQCAFDDNVFEETESVLFLCVSLDYQLCSLDRDKVYFCLLPNSQWTSRHRTSTAQPFQFTQKIGLVHGLHLWNPLHVQ